MSNVIGENDLSSGMSANCMNFGLKVFLKSIAVLIIVSSPKLLIFPIVSGYFSLKMLLYHFSLSTFYFSRTSPTLILNSVTNSAETNVEAKAKGYKTNETKFIIKLDFSAYPQLD